jgi:DNA-binding transcriptional ArsR family regulator
MHQSVTKRVDSGMIVFVSMKKRRVVCKMPASENNLKNASVDTKAAPRRRNAKGADQRLKVAQRASILLKHVSDPTRLQVVLLLSEGEQHVGSLCEQLSQSQPAVSHHLALMRHGGVILSRRQGKNNYYSLTEKGQDLSKVVKAMIG